VNRKFTKLFESYLGRFTGGGLLLGDIVSFKSGVVNHPDIKGNEIMKTKIQELLASDLNLRVISIKNGTPMPFSGDNDNNISGRNNEVVIAQEIAPSRYWNYIAVPREVLEVKTVYPNLPPIPDSWKYKAKINIKPELLKKAEENDEAVAKSGPDPMLKNDDTSITDKEFSISNQTRRSTVGNKNVAGDRELDNKNVKIPSSPAEGQQDPASYTANYMPKTVVNYTKVKH
jgi:hypothetical protein